MIKGLLALIETKILRRKVKTIETNLSTAQTDISTNQTDISNLQTNKRDKTNNDFPAIYVKNSGWAGDSSVLRQNAADTSDNFGVHLSSGQNKSGQKTEFVLAPNGNAPIYKNHFGTNNEILHKGNTNTNASKSNGEISAFSSYISANAAISNNSTFYIFFNAIEYDNNSEFDTSRGSFKPKEKGVYRFDVSLHFSEFTQGTKLELSVFVNGSLKKKFIEDQVYYHTDYIFSAPFQLKLNADDEVRITYFVNSGAYGYILGEQHASYFDGAKIG